MWTAMMVAMMLPSLIAMLRPYQGRSKTIVAGGYFAVWVLFGVAIYPLGVALAEVEMRSPAVSRAVPITAAWSFSSPVGSSSRRGRRAALVLPERI
jgi:predicted metal-binding membrane protein